MFLVIDNTENEKVIFYSLTDNKSVQKSFTTNKNIDLLVCLEKFLSGLKSGLKDIKYLGVVVGEGRFTATRLAVTAANSLAYSLKIPIVAVPKNFDQAVVFKLAKAAVAGEYIIPTYSGEARVG